MNEHNPEFLKWLRSQQFMLASDMTLTREQLCRAYNRMMELIAECDEDIDEGTAGRCDDL